MSGKRNIEDEYKKEIKRIKQAIRRNKKLGYEFPENIIPNKPSKVKQSTINRLKKLTPDALRKKAISLPENNYTIPKQKSKKEEGRKPRISTKKENIKGGYHYGARGSKIKQQKPRQSKPKQEKPRKRQRKPNNNPLQGPPIAPIQGPPKPPIQGPPMPPIQGPPEDKKYSKRSRRNNTEKIPEQKETPDDFPHIDKYQQIEEKIREEFYVRGGAIVSHRRFVYVDTETDKMELLNIWRNTVDEWTDTPERDRILYEYVLSIEEQLSILLSAIQAASTDAQYNHGYSEIRNLLSAYSLSGKYFSRDALEETGYELDLMETGEPEYAG